MLPLGAHADRWQLSLVFLLSSSQPALEPDDRIRKPQGIIRPCYALTLW